ncbi:uncharacterized membrane protein YhaH (DUF805 family) [Curtobacterium pusillum]|uniref:Uncharacterized membrane protein YhaH (DUF805 family) n=1 Tax=Curtobacterium pusillum TaxID=69373 RepID=A0AAW3T9B0_9MICO|nr:DUF805 domain-containing protein [Curtobacterium pusillum]MBA8991731.1 uncharacterized membrane protein YhaH (DUF805 family) [Curtobacterium pusillum]
MSDRYPPQNPYGQQPAPTGPGDEPPLWAPWYGISFGKAFVRFWKKYVRFDGRASRSEYWWWYLWSAIIGVVFLIISGILTAATGTTTTTTSSTYVGFSTTSTNPVAGVPIWIYGLAIIIPTLALIVRRLHDANLSGLLALLLLIPFFGAIAVFIMMFLPSNPAGARFDRPERGR